MTSFARRQSALVARAPSGALDVLCASHAQHIYISRPTSLRLLRELTEALEPCKFSINAVQVLVPSVSESVSRASRVSQVIHALARGREWQRSLHLLELFKGAVDMRIDANRFESPSVGDVVTFNAALAALSGSALWSHALAIFEEMPIRRCDPDVVSATWPESRRVKTSRSEAEIEAVTVKAKAECKFQSFPSFLSCKLKFQIR